MCDRKKERRIKINTLSSSARETQHNTQTWEVIMSPQNKQGNPREKFNIAVKSSILQ